MTASVRRLHSKSPSRRITTACPDFLPRSAAHRDLLRPTLERLEKNTSAPRQDRDVAELLLYRDRPTLERAAALRSRLEAAGPDEVMVIRDTLAVQPRHAGIDDLRRVLKNESALPGARLRVACALAELAPDSTADWRPLAAPLAEALLAEHRRELPHWLELLGSAAPLLVQPLSEVCRDPGRDPATQTTAAEALAEVLERERQAESLARATIEARPEAFRILLRELASQGRPGQVLVFLRGVLAERVDDLRDETHKDALAGRQAAAAIALAALGEPESLWPLLRHRSDPRVRSLLIERLRRGQPGPRMLLERLSLGDIDPIERQALLLAWAETRQPAVVAPIKAAVIETTRVLYRDDPHPGVHSAAELLLRRWGGPELVALCQQHLRGRKSRGDGLRWELGPNGHTFVILPAPLEFRMGAPRTSLRTMANRSCTIARSTDRSQSPPRK